MTAFAQSVFENFTANLIASAFIGLFGALVIAKLWRPTITYIQIRKWFSRAVEVGIHDFFPSRESYAVDRKLAFSDYIHSANMSLRYFGHWLAFTIDQHGMLETLCAMANSGKSVKLVLLDPQLPDEILAAYARYLGESETELRSKINTTWEKIVAAKHTLSATGKKCLELRRHQEFIPYSAFWFDKDQSDQHILIDMKLYGEPRKNAYGIELHPVTQKSSRYPSLFERYTCSLNSLENMSTCVA